MVLVSLDDCRGDEGDGHDDDGYKIMMMLLGWDDGDNDGYDDDYDDDNDDNDGDNDDYYNNDDDDNNDGDVMKII